MPAMKALSLASVALLWPAAATDATPGAGAAVEAKAPAVEGALGPQVAKHARCTYYNPSNNDPPGSLDGAYRSPLVVRGQSKISSAAHALHGSSPYKRGGIYTVKGSNGDTFCVRIDDQCEACKGTWFDVLLKDGQRLPYDYCDVYEGCSVAEEAPAPATVPVHMPTFLEREFIAFANRFQKVYSNTERPLRFQAFVENYWAIQRENAKGHAHTLGLTEFADMQTKDFVQAKTCMLSSKPSWRGVKYLGRFQPTGATLPTSVDWSTQGKVTPVKNQQQCGSCWAFSTTGATESAWAIATGKLVSVSEQQLVDCSGSYGNQGCNGGDMDSSFQYEETVGMCTEASYQYQAAQGSCRASSCTVGIPKGGVSGYKDVAVDDTQALMEAVAQQPVSVAIEADQLAFQLYTGGVISSGCGTSLDHGVLIVGYGTENGVDYWKVKNSWGSTWGENGYVRIKRGLAGAGECGIKSSPSFPVVTASSAINV